MVTLQLWEPTVGFTRFVKVDKTTVRPGDVVQLEGERYEVVSVHGG